MTRQELQKKLNLLDKMHFLNSYLAPALEQGILERTLPDKPNSRLQKYRLTPKGKNYLEKD
jgi:predicted transcriptional regulator